MMDLATAQRYARTIVDWLKPKCFRLAIAGSVRRRRAQCADVDIVCIPYSEVEKDMLGTQVSRRNLVLEFLQAYVREKNPSGSKVEPPYFISGGEREGKQVMLQLPKCQLDLWFADERTWATRLLCRTGSKEHNIWLCQRAREHNGKWDPYEGLTINGVAMPCPTEECIYAALGLKFIEPEHREMEWINKNLEFGL